MAQHLQLQWGALLLQPTDLLDTSRCREQICCVEVPFSYISARHYISNVSRSLQGALWQETQSSSLLFVVSVLCCSDSVLGQLGGGTLPRHTPAVSV